MTTQLTFAVDNKKVYVEKDVDEIVSFRLVAKLTNKQNRKIKHS